MSSLDGIRVIEIGTSVAAPYAGQILADLGSDVIKVERPGSGDDSRVWGPPFWGEESAAFLALNRNKRSLALDFKLAEGREILEQLLCTADVLIQNLRPGALAAAGFDRQTIHRLNPRIVYCEITGYGSTGPMAGDPAYDPMIQAYSGIVGLTGEEGRPPVRVPVSLLDMGSAMWTVIAALDGLRLRESTGVGSHREVSLLGTATAWLTIPLTGVLAGDGPPARMGSGMAAAVPHGAFRCADGYVFVSGANQTLWERICHAIERPDLIADPRFVDNPTRVGWRHDVTETLEDAFAVRSARELIAALQQAGVPCAPVNTLTEAIADEQMQATGVMMAAHHSRIENFTVVATPIARDGLYPPYRRQPPDTGQDSYEILAELGVDETRRDELLGKRVIGRSTTSPSPYPA